MPVTVPTVAMEFRSFGFMGLFLSRRGGGRKPLTQVLELLYKLRDLRSGGVALVGHSDEGLLDFRERLLDLRSGVLLAVQEENRLLGGRSGRRGSGRRSGGLGSFVGADADRGSKRDEEQEFFHAGRDLYRERKAATQLYLGGLMRMTLD